uniref:Uncharacterized protein n=1 Tax=Physcomitrium patens TaxID=3218 RepID=A0A2K1L9E8_PHYPA|nr:hypothetical protein PHYPA_001066 [Physcomitrium patens]
MEMANNLQSTQLTIDTNLHQTLLNEEEMEREVKEILTNMKYERLDQPLDSPRTTQRQQRINEARQRWYDAVPYGPEDLIHLVDSAQQNPSFQGSITILEIYGATTQYLHGDNFQRWMADGRQYFDLGPRHPR